MATTTTPPPLQAPPRRRYHLSVAAAAAAAVAGLAAAAAGAHPATAAAAGALAGALAGPALVRFAARRTLAQPLSQHPEVEAELIGRVVARPDVFCVVADLRPEDFAVPVHRRAWAALCEVLDAETIRREVVARGLDRVRDLPADDVLRAVTHAGAAERTAHLAGLLDTVCGTDLAARSVLAPHDPGVDIAGLGAAKVLELGMTVAADADDRGRLGGAGEVSPTGDPAKPLARRYREPGPGRVWGGTAALAVTVAAVAVFAAQMFASGWAVAAATASLWVLAAASVVIALVDVDTFYLDTPVFWPAAAASWAAAVAACAADGAAGRALSGVFIVVLVAVFLEVVNRAYRALRGIYGVGFGDTIIIVATSGVPAALTGSLTVGFWAFMAGLFVAIAVMGAQLRSDVQRPFAFGPFLAAGWPLALAADWVVGALAGAA